MKLGAEDKALFNLAKRDLALEYFSSGDYEIGIDILEKLLTELDELDPIYNSVIGDLATACYLVEDYEMASQYFGAYTFHDDSPMFHYEALKYLWSLFRSGQYQQVITQGTAFLKIKKETDFQSMILDQMFTVYIELEDYEAAKEVNERMLILEPHNIAFHIDTAYLYDRMSGKKAYNDHIYKLMKQFKDRIEELKPFLHE